MLDSILLGLRDEIAIDGEQGTQLSTIWQYFRQIQMDKAKDLTGTAVEPVMDLAYKAFVWKFLRTLEGLTFVEENAAENGAKEPSKKKKTADKQKKQVKRDPDDDEDEDEYMPDEVDDESEEEDDDDDVPKLKAQPVVGIAEMDYANVEAQYGDRLRAVADSQLQNEQLYIGAPPGQIVSINLMIVLKTILQARSNGVPQSELTKILNLDARSTGHYVKSLEDSGFIIRTTVTYAGTHTNLCVHIRYGRSAPETFNGEEIVKPNFINTLGEAFYMEDVKRQMHALLVNAHNNIMTRSDILTAMGFDPQAKGTKKWFQRCCDTLIARGFIKKFITHVGTRVHRCYQLVDFTQVPKTGEKQKPLNADHMARPFVLQSTLKMESAGKLLRDVPNEYQILQLLRTVDVQGTTQKDIERLLNIGESRIVYKMLERIISMSGPTSQDHAVCRALEFEGRLKRYRYYTYPAYMKAVEHTDVAVSDNPPTFLFNEKDLKLVDKSKRVLPTRNNTGKRLGRPPKSDKSGKAGPNSPKKGPGRPGKSAKLPQAASSTVPTPSLPNATDDTTSTPNQPSSQPETQPDATHATSQPPASSGTTSMPVDSPAPELSTAAKKSSRKGKAPSKLAPIFTRQRKAAAAAAAAAAAEGEASVSDVETAEPPSQATSPLNDHVVESSISQASKGVAARKLPTRSSKRKANEQMAKLSQLPAAIAPRPTDEDEVPAPTEPPSSYQVDDRPVKKKRVSDYFVRFAKPKGVHVQISPKLAFTPLPGNDASNVTQTVPESPVQQNEPQEEEEEEVQDMTMDEVGQDASASGVPQKRRKKAAASISPLQKRLKPEKKLTTTTMMNISHSRHKRTHLQKNLYLEQRNKTVLKMLEDKPVMEFNRVFHLAFEKKRQELFGGSAQTSQICGKTIRRSCQQLADEGLLKFEPIRYTLLNGSQQERWLVFRPELDMTSTEVQEYSEYIKDYKMMVTPAYKMATITEIEAPESLEARLGRMEAELDVLVKERRMSAAERLEKQINEIKHNQAHVEAVSEEAPVQRPGNWLLTAMQFGYINSRIIRAKLVYQYMFGLLGRPDVEGVNKEERTINSATMIYEMPISLFCQAIGIQQVNQVLCQFLEDPGSLDLTVREVPEEVQPHLFAQGTRFRRRLRVIMDLLTRLGLVTTAKKVLTTMSAGSIPGEYRLERHVTMKDHRQPGIPVVGEYTLDDAQMVLLYWSDLQFLCTNTDAIGEELYFEKGDEEEAIDIRSLYTARNWSTMYVFSKEQRKMLNSLIDRKEKTTPYREIDRCREISESLGLPILAVRGYYKKVEEAYERKRDRKTIQRIEGATFIRRRKRRSNLYEDPTNRVITLTTALPFKKKRGIRWNQHEPFSAVNPPSDNNHLFMDNQKMLPAMSEHELQKSLNGRVVRRQKWNSEEDELLLYSHAILRLRAQWSRFYWGAILQVLPDRKPNVVRNRYRTLRQIPSQLEKMYKLDEKWKRYHEEGIASGAIDDGDRTDMVNFDILSHLAYFLERARDDTTSDDPAGAIVLPNSVEAVGKVYRVLDNAYTGEPRMDDEYHKALSLASKQQLFSSTMITLGMSGPKSEENTSSLVDVTKEDRIKELLMILFKMILLTPAEVYDPFYTFGIMEQYPPTVLQATVSEARTRGLLTKAHGARSMDRRLPGTTWGISNHFLAHMAPQWPPNMVAQAKEYEKHLTEANTSHISSLAISSGIMACVLNLMAEDKATVSIENRAVELAKHRVPYHRRRTIDRQLLQFSMKVHLDEPRQYTAPVLNTVADTLTPLNFERFEEIATGLLQLHTEEKPWLETILRLFRTAGEDGLTLVELKEKFVAVHDVEDRVMLRCLDILRKTTPPLVADVGYRVQRLVLTTYLEKWLIVPCKIPVPRAVRTHNTENTREFGHLRKTVVVPRLWNDVNGNRIPVIAFGCFEAMLGSVAERPGINLSQLCRLYKDALARIEIQDLLVELEACGAVRSLTIQVQRPQKKKNNLFSGLTQFSILEKDTIAEETETCYWVLPGYYSKLPVS
ncbi:uncharacterized protein BYT42DRAFT_647852 [Radiomyces spectabilis]|uniref:uncharacterized protein n=1 Tax=Radiomyces spectabilis TaxID=64574 RepID=UPI00221FB513|nr:uncharacterized protein BYT42DRAFT_647852 [Radiomyces spectabilis]KAI8370628.1 hypothetical protein BYT42DRAFT_647852 [Radiomyces spectabilis]